MCKNPWEMTDAELAEYIEQMKNELARRQSLEAVRVQIGDAIKDARGSGVLETPEAGADYVEPDDATKLCVKGDVRTHNGETWVLEHGACVGPPSVENGWVKADPAD
ncbi:hypothetical protein [Brachybacterium subflavum]|uniref:hypothetical protein n=1 Tax=Brachybacterium subflavum TaxID=2585206 RepID=UPI00126686A5|nr:hypothetical protein [Brachybacterium subflavum]